MNRRRLAALLAALPAAVPLAGCGAGALRAVGARPASSPWLSSVHEQPRGTLLWGGAGLDGDYVHGMVLALQRAGVRHVGVGHVDSAAWALGSMGMFIDALRAGLTLRREDDGDWAVAEPPLAPGQGDPAAPFNLIGYSYGSLVAAQTARYHAERGWRVDHLVLIGSPIEAGFLARLRAHPRIGRVVVVDLKERGDPIFAGMPQTELNAAATLLARQMAALRGEGHFYYAHPVPDAPARWAALARDLVAHGLR